jgi:hypothetical protein
MTSPDTLKALPDYPEADKYVDCGEVRPLPMYHLSTLLQFGEKCARAAVESLASADEGVPARGDLLKAAINCEHVISQDSIKLYFDPSEPGTNALNQLGNRLQAALSAQSTAADEMAVALRLARDELAGLPHSLGYSFTHLPAIDAALAAHEAKHGGKG